MNECTVNGVRYVAQPDPVHSCRGCAGNGWDLCFSLPPCGSPSVIWVRDDAPQQHPDDIAVGLFAAAMKAKLAEARAKGRTGWNDKAAVTDEWLAMMLVEHVAKGDPVDVANFAMFLHQRGADHAVLKEASHAT